MGVIYQTVLFHHFENDRFLISQSQLLFLKNGGGGILVQNWDCQNQRNPGKPQTVHETILRNSFGVDTIIWAYGHDEEDGTTGHC